jgi:hypothetical protein
MLLLSYTIPGLPVILGIKSKLYAHHNILFDVYMMTSLKSRPLDDMEYHLYFIIEIHHVFLRGKGWVLL